MKKIIQLFLIGLLVVGLMPVALAFQQDTVKTYDQCKNNMFSCRAKFVEYSPGQANINNGGKFNFVGTSEIRPGWNLLSMYAYTDLKDELLANEKSDFIKGAFLYNPVNGQYYSDYELNQKMSPEKEAALSKYSEGFEDAVPYVFWVYLDKEIENTPLGGEVGNNFFFDMEFLGNRRSSVSSAFPMFKGWNFVTILPDMIIDSNGKATKKLGDTFSECEILKAYAFNSNTQKWEDVMTPSFNAFTDEVSAEGIGVSLVIKVADACKADSLASSSSNGLTAPALPN